MATMPNDSNGNNGPATDRNNAPVIDPTKNVLDLVRAESIRQDGLREAESRHIRELASIRAEYDSAIGNKDQHIAELRASYEEKLRLAESKRIDAIRAVDADAVARAATVANTAASALAGQVVAAAEANRSQVESQRVATADALSATVGPLATRIDSLLAAQFAQQGEKAVTASQPSVAEQLQPVLNRIEALQTAQTLSAGAKENQTEHRQQSNWSTGTILTVVIVLATVISLIVYVGRKPSTTVNAPSTPSVSCSVAIVGQACVK